MPMPGHFGLRVLPIEELAELLLALLLVLHVDDLHDHVVVHLVHDHFLGFSKESAVGYLLLALATDVLDVVHRGADGRLQDISIGLPDRFILLVGLLDLDVT